MAAKESEQIQTSEAFWEQVKRINKQILLAQSDRDQLAVLWDQKYLLILYGRERNWIAPMKEEDIWKP